jgi:hypothetical protein
MLIKDTLMAEHSDCTDPLSCRYSTPVSECWVPHPLGPYAWLLPNPASLLPSGSHVSWRRGIWA